MIHKIHFAPYKSTKFTVLRENSDDFADSWQPKIIFQEQGTSAQWEERRGREIQIVFYQIFYNRKQWQPHCSLNSLKSRDFRRKQCVYLSTHQQC